MARNMARNRKFVSKNGRSLVEILAARTTPSSRARARANYGQQRPRLNGAGGVVAPGGDDRRYFKKPAKARAAGRRWS